MTTSVAKSLIHVMPKQVRWLLFLLHFSKLHKMIANSTKFDEFCNIPSFLVGGGRLKRLLFVLMLFRLIFSLLLKLFYFYRQVSLLSLLPYLWVSRQEQAGWRLLSAMNSKNSTNLQISCKALNYVKTNGLPSGSVAENVQVIPKSVH